MMVGKEATGHATHETNCDEKEEGKKETKKDRREMRNRKCRRQKR